MRSTDPLVYTRWAFFGSMSGHFRQPSEPDIIKIPLNLGYNRPTLDKLSSPKKEKDGFCIRHHFRDDPDLAKNSFLERLLEGLGPFHFSAFVGQLQEDANYSGRGMAKPSLYIRPYCPLLRSDIKTFFIANEEKISWLEAQEREEKSRPRILPSDWEKVIRNPDFSVENPDPYHVIYPSIQIDPSIADRYAAALETDATWGAF